MHHDPLVQGEIDFNSCVTLHLADITHEVRLWDYFLDGFSQIVACRKYH